MDIKLNPCTKCGSNNKNIKIESHILSNKSKIIHIYCTKCDNELIYDKLRSPKEEISIDKAISSWNYSNISEEDEKKYIKIDFNHIKQCIYQKECDIKDSKNKIDSANSLIDKYLKDLEQAKKDFKEKYGEDIILKED